jgi:histidinol dehydrogenase
VVASLASITCLRDRHAAADRLSAIAERTSGSQMADATARVEAIVEQVRREGDRALLELSERFDGVRPDPLRIPAAELEAAWQACDRALRQALELAHERILAFHQRQLPADLQV